MLRYLVRDGVTFLKVRGLILWTPDQKWGAQPYIYYCPAKIMGGPGPPGPLDDYMPAKWYVFAPSPLFSEYY